MVGAHVTMGQNLEAIIMPTYTFLFQIQAENLLNQPLRPTSLHDPPFFVANYHVLNYSRGIHFNRQIYWIEVVHNRL